MRKLPSLRAVRVFEVCARLSNISMAARELHLTHSAVSHQVKLLEDWFGQPLFTRHANGVQLTPAGAVLARASTLALDQLEIACEQVRSTRSRHVVRLAAPGSFMALWLIRRLEDFERSHPEVQLQLQTQGDLHDLVAQRIDALVVSAQPPWPRNVSVRTLFDDCSGPVCAPDWPTLPATPADLAGQPLLYTLSRREAWLEWGSLHGLDHELLDPGRHFDNLQLMLEAAVARLGVAIAPQQLVQRELLQGRLIAPLGFTAGPSCFALCVAQARTHEPALLALQEWMTKQVAAA